MCLRGRSPVRGLAGTDAEVRWRDRTPGRDSKRARYPTAVLRFARQNNPGKVWAARLLERKRPKVVAVALANKTARIASALMVRGATYAVPAA